MSDLKYASTLFLSKDIPLAASAIETGCSDFQDLCDHIAALSYRRNPNRHVIDGVLKDNCGTCSSKHRFLAAVAEAHAQRSGSIQSDWNEIRLFIGVFEMHAQNTPPITAILHQYGLQAIPEAHCYLKYKGVVMDHTSSTFNIPFQDTLLYEQEVGAASLYDVKDTLHKSIIDTWRADNAPHLTTESIWMIREKCIEALSR